MKILVGSFLMLVFLAACDKDSESGGVEWELVWEDNFNVEGSPDSTIWDYEVGYVRNNEEQYYTKNRLENARVENGTLIIEARKDNWEGNEITSASLHTYGKKAFYTEKLK